MRAFKALGFSNPRVASANLEALTPTPRDAELLAPVVPRLLAELSAAADPDMALNNLERGIAAFAATDRTLAQEVLEQRPFMRAKERELRESHLGRLRAGLAESLETSEIHLDILTNLKRISSHVSALMFPILDEV